MDKKFESSVKSRLMTTGQAAVTLGTTPQSVRQYLKRKTLAGFPLGKIWLVYAASVKELQSRKHEKITLSAGGNPDER